MGPRRAAAPRALRALGALAACCLLVSCAGGPGGSDASGGQGATATPARVTIDPNGLLNAEVPALCDHSAGGRLVNGALPGQIGRAHV